MADPEAVRRALAQLATGETTAESEAIDRATTAIQDVGRAAEFVERVGLEELEQSIAAATAAGDVETARRGQLALAAFERFEDAAGGPSETADGSPSNRDSTVHFRSGRGSHLTPDCKASRT